MDSWLPNVATIRTRRMACEVRRIQAQLEEGRPQAQPVTINIIMIEHTVTFSLKHAARH
jgi:hypothetical protein